MSTMQVQALSAGWDTSLAICSDSTAWAWGPNEDGELGTGNYSPTVAMPDTNNLPLNVATLGVYYCVVETKTGTRQKLIVK